MNTVLLIPHLSEKVYRQSIQDNIYAFNVPMGLSKQAISAEISKQYEVTVTKVNVLVRKGKTTSTYRKRGRAMTGSRSDVRIAYVHLKDGDSIPMFANVQDANEGAK
jgi:ribosomal protein L23